MAPAVFVLIHRNLRRQRREVLESFLAFQEAETAALEVRLVPVILVALAASFCGGGRSAGGATGACSAALVPVLLPRLLPSVAVSGVSAGETAAMEEVGGALNCSSPAQAQAVQCYNRSSHHNTSHASHGLAS